METDSASQIGASLEFDFDFDDDNLMDKPNTQMPSNQPQSETAAGTFSCEYVELGSSSGSNQPVMNQTNSRQNLTVSTITSGGYSEPPLENAQNLAQPAATSFNPPLLGTPQSYHPTTDFAELGSPGGQSQLNVGNPNSNYAQHGYNFGEKSGPPPVVNSSSLTQLATSTPLIGAPQPYPPPMVRLITHDGAVHSSFQPENEANLIYPNQQINLQSENVPLIENIPLTQNMGSLNQCSTNNQIAHNIANNNFNNIIQQPSLHPTLFPQNTMGEGVINQRSLPMINQHHATLNPHNQNASYRPLTPLGPQSNQFMTANVLDPQCINFMLPQAYALLRPQQLSNQLQQLNQVPQMQNLYNLQCQYSMLPGHSMPIRPQNLLYHQLNEFPAQPNVYDPQGYNSMQQLPELSMPLRTPQHPNQDQQLNQVWMTNNCLLPGSCLPSRLQQLYDLQQLNQLAQVMPNVFNPQLCNSMAVPERIMLSGAPQLPGHHEPNQVLVAPYVSSPQQLNLVPAGPSVQLPSRPQRLSDHQRQVEQVQMMPSVTNSQLCSSLPPQPSILSRPQQLSETANRIGHQQNNSLPPESSIPSSLQTIKFQGLLNQTATQSVSYPYPGTNTRESQILNSQTQQREPISERQRRCATNRHVFGESSLSSKRSKRETIRQEKRPLASSHQEEDVTSQSEGYEVERSNLSYASTNTRKLKNSVYDPKFEGVGLPVDPHLRLFSSG